MFGSTNILLNIAVATRDSVNKARVMEVPHSIQLTAAEIKAAILACSPGDSVALGPDTMLLP